MSVPRRFANRWEVIEPMPDGGQSHIYKVKDLTGEYNEELVLKRLKNIKRIERFEHEIKSLQRLRHKGIGPVVDYSLSDPPFFVTEFYPGGPLSNIAPLPTIKALDLFIAICDAVAYAHEQGVFHRDLKPDNIVLDQNEEPVIIDFGLCYLEEEDKRLTATMEQVGSRFYMAPELEAGRAEKVTDKIDSYALGKIIYFLLTKAHLVRENYREENDLTRITKDEQTKYVSDRILDFSVIHDPRARKSVVELKERARNVRRLIFEHYYPGREGSLCRFCGEGHYTTMKKYTTEIREPGLIHSVHFDVFYCDKCGNIQWFGTPN